MHFLPFPAHTMRKSWQGSGSRSSDQHPKIHKITSRKIFYPKTVPISMELPFKYSFTSTLFFRGIWISVTRSIPRRRQYRFLPLRQPPTIPYPASVCIPGTSALQNFIILSPRYPKDPGHGSKARIVRSRRTGICEKSRWPSF